MTVEESIEFFKEYSSIVRKLKPLNEVGLGYITLGQSSNSLSGGEAQRVKLASLLGKGRSDFQHHVLFIFDEPTTGLHFHDIEKLLAALNALIEQGNTVIVIEHNLEVIKNADWIIDCRGMAANDPNIRGVKGETLLVRNTEFSLSRPVRLMHPRYPLYIIPREDHVFMIGATVIESAENENVSLRSSMELMSALYALSPSFGEAEIIEIKAGIRPSYTDNLPRITINENMIGCNGLFRHGYLLASVMAACVADHLSETENEFMHLFKDETHESDNQRRREELRSAA